MGLLGRSLKRRQKRRNYAGPANTTDADRGWITEPAECSAEPRSIASKYPARSAKDRISRYNGEKDETNQHYFYQCVFPALGIAGPVLAKQDKPDKHKKKRPSHKAGRKRDSSEAGATGEARAAAARKVRQTGTARKREISKLRGGNSSRTIPLNSRPGLGNKSSKRSRKNSKRPRLSNRAGLSDRRGTASSKVAPRVRRSARRKRWPNIKRTGNFGLANQAAAESLRNGFIAILAANIISLCRSRFWSADIRACGMAAIGLDLWSRGRRIGITPMTSTSTMSMADITCTTRTVRGSGLQSAW